VEELALKHWFVACTGCGVFEWLLCGERWSVL